MTENNSYNEAILEHANHPSHEGKIKTPDFEGVATNSSCGDEITLMLKLDKNDKVVDASWTGKGCAIAKASADILCSTLLLENNDNIYLDEIAEKMPGRIKCIETAFNALRHAPPSVLLTILQQSDMSSDQ